MTILQGAELPSLNMLKEQGKAIMLRAKRLAEKYKAEKKMQLKTPDVPIFLQSFETEQEGLSRDIAQYFAMEMKMRDAGLLEGGVNIRFEDGREVIDIEPSKDMPEQDIQKEVAKLTKEQAEKLKQAIFYIEDMARLYAEAFDNPAIEEYAECRICELCRIDDYVRIAEVVDLRYSEFPLFKARDVNITEFVKLVRV
jgi:hypothetical protein